jgi:nitroreductase
MEFADVVKRRRMVRKYSDEPVDREVIERMMDLVKRGPSAGFSQGQYFVVVTEQERRQEIADFCGEQHYVEAGFEPWISKAPIHVLPCACEADYHRRYQEPDKLNDEGNEINWPVPYWYMDIGCSVMTLLLAAVNEGLSAGFAGSHKMDDIKDYLGIPDEMHPVGIITIGHGLDDRKSGSLKRGRKETADVIHYEEW